MVTYSTSTNSVKTVDVVDTVSKGSASSTWQAEAHISGLIASHGGHAVVVALTRLSKVAEWEAVLEEFVVLVVWLL